jgi:hypothetical protein
LLLAVASIVDGARVAVVAENPAQVVARTREIAVRHVRRKRVLADQDGMEVVGITRR